MPLELPSAAILDLNTELRRLVHNAAMRRTDLINSALKKTSRRKLFTILAGILALSSAATITAVLTKLIGAQGLELVSAGVALLSGAISLVTSAYYNEEDTLNRFAGAAKYLSLRDSVFRVAVSSDQSESEKVKALHALQAAYAELDSIYSRYFTLESNAYQFGFLASVNRIRNRNAWRLYSQENSEMLEALQKHGESSQR